MNRDWAVHKFGGASVRDAEGVRNLGRILRQLQCGEDADAHQAIVVSAMGKTTNALEAVWQALPYAADVEPVVAEVVADHLRVVDALHLPTSLLDGDLAAFRTVCASFLGRPRSDAGYDAVVGFGERWSTRIVAAHLVSEGLPAVWTSAWSLVRTNGTHRSAEVDLEHTRSAIRSASRDWGNAIPVMQGFVGSADSGAPTTLGREGSDFSGALLAEALGARRFCVWKDVPGVMTGDPRSWPAAEVLPHLDHSTAELMGRAGAGVLHPDTMAPLRRADIPLHVRSFMDPEAPGTCIQGATPDPALPALWTLSAEEQGRRTVRCIGRSVEEACRLWSEQCPETTVIKATPDPEFPRCVKLVVQRS